MDSNSIIVDVSQDISPDGIPLRQAPSSDIDRALNGGKKVNDIEIKDLPKVDENTPDDNAQPNNTGDDDITIDSFLEKAGKEIAKEAKKDEDKKEEPVIEDKQKEDEKVVDKPNDKQLSQPKSQEKSLPQNRDYSDIEEAHVDAFKRMHNDSFNLLKPIYKEHKTLKQENATVKKSLEETTKQLNEIKTKGGQLPESYYENPQGFLLDPEFHTAAKVANDAQTVYNHWMKQYQDVAGGAKEFDYLDRDPKTGQLFIHNQKIKAEAGIEAKLLSFVTNAQMYLNDSNVKMQALQMNHSTKSQEAIKSLNDQIVNDYKDFDTEKNKPIYEPLIKQELQGIHPIFRNSPLALGYAKARVMNFALGKVLISLQEQLKSQNGNGKQIQQQQNKRNVQPSAEEINGAVNGVKSGKKDEGEDITTDDFSRLKGEM